MALDLSRSYSAGSGSLHPIVRQHFSRCVCLGRPSIRSRASFAADRTRGSGSFVAFSMSSRSLSYKRSGTASIELARTCGSEFLRPSMRRRSSFCQSPLVNWQKASRTTSPVTGWSTLPSGVLNAYCRMNGAAVSPRVLHAFWADRVLLGLGQVARWVLHKPRPVYSASIPVPFLRRSALRAVPTLEPMSARLAPRH